MQFVDLKKQYELIKGDVLERITKVLDHGIYIMGPEIQELECKLAEYVKAKHCIAVASGTDALLVAMMALDIGQGDEVITTPFTFIATAEMICVAGATPVFVDIDPQTYNINPALLEQAITSRTKAIMPVNLYGQCADFDAINAIAAKHNISVIEDAAQSFGATYKNRFSCNLGTIGCTSFFPAKPLGCYGDGGACFTDDDELADKMRKIRNHGQSTRYNHVALGLNSRLDTMQAAILLSKLELFYEEVTLREKVAKKYNEKLKSFVAVPFIHPDNTSIYAQYTIQVEDRSQVQKLLLEKNIPTAVHYPVPLHKQPIFQSYDWSNVDLSVSEQAAGRVMSLPFHPYLSDEDIETVVSSIAETLELVVDIA
ncbi:MAG: DegT/DnrJ/EryC1/StrS family aminotransferase [Gammaproteobacteria bacterium]|nr:DegT/DnrJ/EryC1/StrS family aminotransferase [Gammaproteobacteria bacterium]